MTWCEQCAIGIHIRCANDHAIGHGEDDCIGFYRAKDIAAKSLLCLGCWTTHRLYADESDEEEIERGDQPERHPNRLRWWWAGRLKETLNTAARRERATHAELDDGRSHHPQRASRTPAQARSGSPQATAAAGGAPTPRCDVGLAAHGSAYDYGPCQPARHSSARTPPREPPAPPPPSWASTSAAPGATPPASATACGQRRGVGRRELDALPSLGAHGNDPRPRCDCPSGELPAATSVEPARRHGTR